MSFKKQSNILNLHLTFSRILVLIVVLSGFMYNGYLLSENNTPQKSIEKTSTISLIGSPSDQTLASFQPILGTNVSQFDVQENVTTKFIKETILPLSENITQRLPDGWQFNLLQLNLSSVYTNVEFIENQNITGSKPAEWSNGTNTNNLTTFWNQAQSRVELSSRIGIPTSIPLNLHAFWTETGNNKPTESLNPMETSKIRNFSVEYSFSDDFSNPSVQSLYKGLDGDTCPYGGTKIWATATAAVYQGTSLSLYIKAGSATAKIGNPSVAWQRAGVVFDRHPDKVELYLKWQKQNLNFELPDNYLMIARIDDNYIDGRYDTAGNFYSNASSTALVWDNSAESVPSHGWINRTWNITNFVNYSRFVHILDFGIWLSTMDQTNDEVLTLFAEAAIILTYTDQYFIGRMGFHVELISSDNSSNAFLPFGLFYQVSSTLNATRRFFTEYVGALSDIYAQMQGEGNYKRYVSKALGSNAKTVFSGSNISISFYIVSMYNTTQSKNFSVFLDDISTSVQYGTRNITEAGLQHWNTSEWVNLTNPIFYTNESKYILASNLSLQFRFVNVSMQNFSLSYTGSARFSRIRTNSAWASYNVPSFASNLSTIPWSLYFNTTPSVNDFSSDPDVILLDLHQIEIIGIPAFDNKGNASDDWKVLDLWSPIPFGSTERVILTSTIQRKSPIPGIGLEQSVFINFSSQLLQYGGGLLNGTYIFNISAPNYLSNCAMLDNAYAPKEVFYHGNPSTIVVNISTLGYGISQGNLNLSIIDPLQNPSTGFPRYITAHAGNYSDTWNIIDTQNGLYTVLATWNDTSQVQTGKTYRFGYRYDPFDVFRQTQTNIISFPSGAIATGTKGTYVINYSTLTGVEIQNATVVVKNNATGNLWGLDFGLGQYLIDPIQWNGGVHTIMVRTEFVPAGTYMLRFDISKSYFDTKTVYLALTITSGNMKIQFNEGVVNNSGELRLDNNTIPFVNESFRSFIIINATTIDAVPQPIRDGMISGQFNTSGSPFTFKGFELFSLTQAESDKGRYIIYLNTTNCHETLSGQYFHNLSLYFSSPGYEPKGFQIIAPIRPLPSSLSAQIDDSVFEGGILNVISTYSNIINEQTPIPIRNADLIWTIKNQSGTLRQGILQPYLATHYKNSINLSADFYLVPGLYEIEINASCQDFQPGSLTRNFTVLSRKQPMIQISFLSEVRIGHYLSMYVNFTDSNNLPIPFASSILTIRFGQRESFSMIKQTGITGTFSHSLFIDFLNADLVLNATVDYQGNESIFGAIRSIETPVLGKFNGNISFIDLPATARPGYSQTIIGQLEIERRTNYENYFLIITGIYDDNDSGSVQYSFIDRVYCNQTGGIEYRIDAIEDARKNLSITLEFGGSATEEYIFEKRFIQILPKWTVNFTLEDTPEKIRIGQSILFKFTFSFVDSYATEKLSGMVVSFHIYNKEGQSVYITEGYLNSTNQITFSYSIPEFIADSIRLNISFSGNSKIKEKSSEFEIPVYPKVGTSITVLQDKIIRGFVGSFYFSAKLQDSEGNIIQNAKMYFILKDQQGKVIQNLSATTNEQGIASCTMELNVTGRYRLEVQYNGETIYASSSNSDSGYNNVEVINFFTIIVENISTILLMSGLLIASILSIRRFYVLPKRQKRTEELKKIFQDLTDVQNVQYVMVIHKERGLPLFAYSYSQIPLDEVLISGFLSAITSFGQQIGTHIKSDDNKQKKKSKTTEERKPEELYLDDLSYHQFRISFFEGEKIRTALLLLKPATSTLREKIKQFNAVIEQDYAKNLENWSGEMLDTQKVLEVLEFHIKADLLYYHNVNEDRVDEIKKIFGKKSIYSVLLEQARGEFKNRFRILDLMNFMAIFGFKEVDVFKAISDLRSLNVLLSMNPKTQNLIDKFKPFIKNLDNEAKTVLKFLSDQPPNTMKLIKESKITNLDKAFYILKVNDLIDDEKRLTETGFIVRKLLPFV